MLTFAFWLCFMPQISQPYFHSQFLSIRELPKNLSNNVVSWPYAWTLALKSTPKLQTEALITQGLWNIGSNKDTSLRHLCLFILNNTLHNPVKAGVQERRDQWCSSLRVQCDVFKCKTFLKEKTKVSFKLSFVNIQTQTYHLATTEWWVYSRCPKVLVQFWPEI